MRRRWEVLRLDILWPVNVNERITGYFQEGEHFHNGSLRKLTLFIYMISSVIFFLLMHLACCKFLRIRSHLVIITIKNMVNTTCANEPFERRGRKPSQKFNKRIYFSDIIRDLTHTIFFLLFSLAKTRLERKRPVRKDEIPLCRGPKYCFYGFQMQGLRSEHMNGNFFLLLNALLNFPRDKQSMQRVSMEFVYS